MLLLDEAVTKLYVSLVAQGKTYKEAMDICDSVYILIGQINRRR